MWWKKCTRVRYVDILLAPGCENDIVKILYPVYVAMPKRLPFKENTYYHLYNRSLQHQTIFHEQRDYQRFVRYLQSYVEKYASDLTLVAYCVLPNHFHLVCHNHTLGHILSSFIGNTCAAYVRYYKAKYGTERGSVFFESRFKAKELNNEDYLNQCIFYVENNPLKHQLIDDINQWVWRSTTSSWWSSEIINFDREF